MIDTHLHLWDRRRLSYPWLDRPDFERLPRAVGLASVPPLAGESGVVLVEAGATGADTGLLLDAGRDPRVLGVVPALEDPRLAERLAEPLVRAVRWQAQRAPEDRPLGLGGGSSLVAELVREDRALEIVVRRERAVEAVRAAAEAGARRIVVDHFAGIPRAEEELAAWDADLDRIAVVPGLALKLSGWRPGSAVPLVELVRRVLDRFPPERLIWGSDWPVSSLGGESRSALRDAAIRALAAAGAAVPAKARILGGTAREVYGIGEVTATESTR